MLTKVYPQNTYKYFAKKTEKLDDKYSQPAEIQISILRKYLREKGWGAGRWKREGERLLPSAALPIVWITGISSSSPGSIFPL